MIDTVERKMQCCKEASFSFDRHLKVKVAQSCLTLCDPMDCIYLYTYTYTYIFIYIYTRVYIYILHLYIFLQARILEWVAFPFSRKSFQSRDQTQVSRIAGRFITSWATRVCVCSAQSCFSRVRLFATLWTVARQTPLSMGFSRQEYRVGRHALLQGILPTQGWNLCLLGILHCRRIPYRWATGEAHLKDPW